MGSGNQPKVWQNIEGEFPDADELNKNFEFLNQVHLNLIRNGEFEGTFSAGLPILWALNGAGAVSAQDADSKDGTKAVKIIFGSAAASLTQDADEFKFYQGRQVKAWCFVKTGTPGVARIRVSDGVASSDSVFHTGDGTYQLLVVTHAVADTATRLTIELRIEGVGDALFDVASLVDFESILGRLQNPKDLAEATKEFFFLISNGNLRGAFSVERVGTSGSANLSGRIPHDFTSLSSIVLIAIPDSTAGPQTVELTSDKAADGEVFSAAQEQDLVNTFSYIANEMTEFDISSVFSAIAADDYFGILIDRQGAGFGNLDIVGIKLRYT